MKKAMNQSVLTLILNGISMLALIFMVFSIISYSNVSKQLNEDNDKRFNLTYNANRFMDGSSYLTNEVRAYAATGNREHYTNYWNEVNNLKNRDLGVAAMQEIGITAEEQALIDEMSTISNTLVPLEENAMNMVQGGKLQEALDYVYGSQYNESVGKINSLKDQFLVMLDKRTASDIEALSNRADTIEITIIIALVLVGVIQLLNMFVVRLQVLKPVLVIEDQMKEISQGNLSAKFSLESNTSEIGMLVGAIHETKRELKKYIKDIDYKLSQMAQGNMNLAIDSDYRGEFLPIQKAMEQILDSLNKALSQINISAEQVSEEAMRVAQGAGVLSNGTRIFQKRHIRLAVLSKQFRIYHSRLIYLRLTPLLKQQGQESREKALLLWRMKCRVLPIRAPLLRRILQSLSRTQCVWLTMAQSCPVIRQRRFRELFPARRLLLQ